MLIVGDPLNFANIALPMSGLEATVIFVAPLVEDFVKIIQIKSLYRTLRGVFCDLVPEYAILLLSW